MQKVYLVLALIIISRITLSSAQSTNIDCASNRYDQEVFSSINITTDVVYGSSLNQSGGTTILKMDIYQPDSDTVAIRPLIIWAHGGSFVAGTKNDGDVVALCEHFAKRGYVCASIEYRLGVAFPPTRAGTISAVWRAVHDMKAAVRFFRQDAATTNVYKIDSDFIVAGGSSAGAFTSMHLAYLDQPSEIPAEIDTMIMGGLEGESGNPGFSSEVQSVVNLCGALGDKSYLQVGDAPLCSMHGTVDGTVPYATAIINYLGIFPIMQVDGSYSINAYADSIGMVNQMYTYYGADHVPYASNAATMDTTVRFVSNFLFTQLGCIPSDPEPLPNTFNLNTTVSEIEGSFEIYPNPVSMELCIALKNNVGKIDKIRINDISGKELLLLNISEPKTKIDLSS
nr:alpha/beta hydrolase [Bacteroidia bacterium]